jgi:nucleotide-binding universal stress UspA family protein
MFKHILLPIDGSDLSRRAIRLGIELVHACHANAYALHVVLP